jgi:hypothetical protein
LNQIFGKRLSQACPLAEGSRLEVILSENGDYKLSPVADDVIRKNGSDATTALYNLKNCKQIFFHMQLK